MADAAAWRRFRPGGQVVFFAVLSLGTGAATWLLKGRAAFLDAIAGSAELVLAILPVLLGAMLLAGYAQSLLPRENEPSSKQPCNGPGRNLRQRDEFAHCVERAPSCRT